MKLVKFRKNIIIGVCATVVVSLGACSNYLDVNDNPNRPEDVPPAMQLSTGLIGAGFTNGNELNRFASTIMSVTAGAGGSPLSYDIFDTDGSDFGNQWSFELYGGSLVNFDLLIKSSQKLGANRYTGIAKIMKAYSFSVATDIWGDVPYSQALQGDVYPQPRLDSQKDIYEGNSSAGIESLFDLVKSGLADLDKDSPLKPGIDDVVYGGEVAKWKKAGNSLLLKLAMQISKVNPTLSKSIINEVLTSNNYIKVNGENLSIKFGSQVGSQNPIYQLSNYDGGQSFRNELIISTRFVSLLQSLNDPRLPVFVTKPSGNYVTIDNGSRDPLPQPIASWSRFSSYLVGANGEAPIKLITASQSAFNLAEAALTLGTGTAADAKAFYEAGITESMVSAGIATADITAYIAANPLTGDVNNMVKQIITQKYIAQYGNGLEQWNDWRRTGYPVLSTHQNAGGIDGTRPARAVYVDQEIARNTNFPRGIFSNVKVWWDVN